MNLNSDLEAVTSDLETRMTAVEENVQGKSKTVDKTSLEFNRNLFIKFLLAESKTQIYFPGLQMTDVELDERITALEENGVAGKFLHIFSKNIFNIEYIEKKLVENNMFSLV